jgi:hypothetical protein
MSTPAEWAAYIGAAAWLPQIASFIYQRILTPKVQLIPERTLELGFTTYGPLFNLRFSLSSDRKDAIISNFEAELQHEGGEIHVLRWSGLRETFSEVLDSAGNRQQLIEKDQPAIALKLSTIVLMEKFVRFQDPIFHERQRPLVSQLVAHFSYLKGQTENYREETLKSREMHDLLEFYRQFYWWKAGRYSARFKIESPNRAQLVDREYAFHLGQADIDAMKANVDSMRAFYEDLTMSDLPNYVSKRPVWNWRNVPLLTGHSVPIPRQ